jgi:hypothetical protein
MVQFTIPLQSAGRQSFSFKVKENAVLFAGSRLGYIPQKTCSALIEAFARLNFSFLVGCARGIDECFRKALSESKYECRTFVACAFPNRIERSYGLFANLVVPFGVPPKAALVRRTLWMVKRSSLLVLFPDNPETGCWGKGSALAFDATIKQIKPAFIISKNPPEENGLFRVFPSSFKGIVSGFWAVPHTLEDGSCDDEW